MCGRTSRIPKQKEKVRCPQALPFSIAFAMNHSPVLLLLLIAVGSCQKYGDLQELGLACPRRDRCRGYSNDLPYTERSCECDAACGVYGDCCVDARRRSPTSSPGDVACVHYGEKAHTGVYAVSRCGRGWDGPGEVKERCEGSPDMSDPVSAAPVTSTSRTITYKNLYCAQCNHADATSLKVFQLKIACGGVGVAMDQLSYDRRKKMWGLKRVDAAGNTDFQQCRILFDLPSYLSESVRFCRANVVSKCARDWTRVQVKRSCEGYMAVVFDKVRAYRNPHCAICNHVDVQGLQCTTNLLDQGRFKPFSLDRLIDLHHSDELEPKCSSQQIYDPFLKTCRRLACAFPGHVVRNGKCVPARS